MLCLILKSQHENGIWKWKWFCFHNETLSKPYPLSPSVLCDKFHWLRKNVFISRELFQENYFKMSVLWFLSYTFSHFINLTLNRWRLMNNYTVMKKIFCI